MNGRALYDRYSRALKKNERHRWDGERYVRSYPVHTPHTFDFLSQDERDTWNELARMITPKPRKASSEV